MSWGIYFHLPFCKNRCRYCAFYSGEPLARLPELLASLEVEMELRRDELAEEPITSVYFGGGTPSLLDPSQVAALLAAVARGWELASDVEVTLEVNPGDPLRLDQLVGAGVSRLSVGVQALDNAMLNRLGRRHTAHQARGAVIAAVAAGFTSVSADLLFGLPGQAPERLAGWISELAAEGIDHLSIYDLEEHPGTELAAEVAAGSFRPASGGLRERQYQAVKRATALHGFSAYEVSNFARPGKQCRHNLSYWTGSGYLGLGPGAHSYLPDRGAWGSRHWNQSDLSGYLAALGRGRLPPSGGENLTREQALLERLFLDLRRPVKLSPRQLAARFDLKAEASDAVFRSLAEKQLFRQGAGGFLTPTRRAIRRADGLAVTIQEQLLRPL